MHCKYFALWTPLLTSNSVAASLDDETVLLQFSVAHKGHDDNPVPPPPGSKMNLHSDERHHDQLLLVENLADAVVRGETKIDDNTKAALQSMLSTLTEFQTGITEAHAADVTLLNDIVTRAGTCSSEFTGGKDEDTQLSGTVSTKHAGHKDCRQRQANELADATAKCDDLAAFVDNLPSPPCQAPGVDGMADFWNSHKAFYDGNFNTWQSRQQACSAATSKHEDTKKECDELQVGYEEGVCSLRLAMFGTCTAYTACHDATAADYDAAVTATQTAELARKAEWKSVEKIKCYIGVLTSDDDGADKQTEFGKCKEAEADVAHLDVAEPALPEKEQCDLSEVNDYPCTDDFLSTKYAGLTGLRECQACADIPAHLQPGGGSGGGGGGAGGPKRRCDAPKMVNGNFNRDPLQMLIKDPTLKLTNTGRWHSGITDDQWNDPTFCPGIDLMKMTGRHKEGDDCCDLSDPIWGLKGDTVTTASNAVYTQVTDRHIYMEGGNRIDGAGAKSIEECCEECDKHPDCVTVSVTPFYQCELFSTGSESSTRSSSLHCYPPYQYRVLTKAPVADFGSKISGQSAGVTQDEDGFWGNSVVVVECPAGATCEA